MNQTARQLTLALVAVFIASAACHAAADGPATLEIGQTAPDFRLPGVDGKDHCLDDFADAQLLAIVFTCNHCPTAQAYEERIKRLAQDYRKKGVALVAVSPNDPQAVRLDELGYTDLGDSLEEMKIRAKHQEFNFPYLYDGDKQQMSQAYGPQATPHVFLFDKARKLRFAGRIDDSAKQEEVKSRDTRAAIDALLAGRPVPVEKTRTFGCSIKWSDKRAGAKASLERWAQEEVALEPIQADGVRALVKNNTEKFRLVNVWATWCGPCLGEMPELVTMHRMYRKREFELVTISADPADRKQQALQALKKEHASMTNYLFTGGTEYDLAEAVDKEWVGPLPYTMLIAPGGKILYRKQGENDPLELKKAIADHLGRVYK
jgi:peroxiredoxin